MDWLFRRLNTDADLGRWEKQRFSVGVELGPRPGDNRDHHERVVAVEAPGLPQPGAYAARLADAILRFDVFPPCLAEGVLRRSPVEIGDTVGVRYHLIPGVDLFFAARVTDRFAQTTAELWRCGFTYRTLQGHPECGEETFVAEKDLKTGSVKVALRSWSRPGLLIARFAHPFVRLMQVRAGRSALDHLEGIAHPESLPTISHSLVSRRDLRTGLFWL
jgi:hypothetical protein